MKKHKVASWKRQRVGKTDAITIGIDLGDRTSQYCVLNAKGEVIERAAVTTTNKGMAQAFGSRRQSRVAIEVGTHSPWVSRLLKSFGHEVIVANARQVQLISKNSRKSDKLDAEVLARLARVDPELLRPIRHRGEQAQAHLAAIRVRAALIEARTGLVNAARGLAKSAANGWRAATRIGWEWDIWWGWELPCAPHSSPYSRK